MNLQLQFLYFVVAAASNNAAFAEISDYMVYNDSSKCSAYRALPAGFGPQLPEERLTTYLTRVIPPNTCHAIENPPTPRKASKTHIPLIQSHDCSFVEKVLHVQQAGYKSTAVHNVDSEQVLTMTVDDKETQQLRYHQSLQNNSSSSTCKGPCNARKMYVSVLPYKEHLGPYQDNAKMLQEILIMQGFRVIFYIVMNPISIMVNIILYKRACKIKLHVYKQGDKYETCTICMADYKKGEYLKILSCSHAYHSICIDTWFKVQSKKKTCPLCRQVVKTYG